MVGCVAAVTETGSPVVASASRPAEHVPPLEDERARRAYGVPSAINRLPALHAESRPGRVTVLLLREAIGFYA